MRRHWQDYRRMVGGPTRWALAMFVLARLERWAFSRLRHARGEA